MNILVTGANGQLGTSIRNAAQQTLDNYIFTDVDELDITGREAICNMVKKLKVDVIVNCAAYTNVDAAEENTDAANLLNNVAVENLATVASEVGATLIHISTDYVFGGDTHNTPYNEEHPTHPTGVYGRTKLAGEQAVLRSRCNHIIIRTAWLYSPYGKNFFKTMLSLTATRPQVNVVCDQVGTPTYAAHLAGAIVHIITSRQLHKQGTYHYSNQGVCSWYDFAHAIASLAHHTQCTVQPCSSSQYPSRVVRPPYSVLDKTHIISTFGINIPHWYDALCECFHAHNTQESI